MRFVFRGSNEKNMKYFPFSTLQVKNLLCKKLAACLCMKPPSSPTVEPPLIYKKNRGVAIGDHIDSTPPSPTTDTELLKKLLNDIHDLLKAQVHNEEVHSYEADKKDDLKHDWMLAAAVVDRICAIAFTLVFIGGTLFFFIVFTVHF